MKRIFIGIFITLLGYSILPAQVVTKARVENIRAIIVDKKIAVNFSITHTSKSEKVGIELKFQQGSKFIYPESITGSIGLLSAGNHTIIWDVLKDIERFEGDIIPIITITKTDKNIVQKRAGKPIITWINPINIESAQDTSSIQIKACVESNTPLWGVEIYLNGGMLRGYVLDESSYNGCKAVIEKKINLQQNENNIYIIVKNEFGTDTSQTLFVTYSKKNNVTSKNENITDTSQTIFVPYINGIKDQKRIALVIGNAKYQNVDALKNPKNDATDIANALKRLNFDVELISDANSKQLIMAINRFGTRVKNADISFFYYAGHGMQVKGNNYLIPVDADIKEENQVEFECVDANRALAYMESGDSKVNIIVMDACRNNPFARNWSKRDLGASRGLASIDAPVGTIIAYATQPGNTAADGSGKNGIYTNALLEFIEKPDLSLTDIFMKVRVKVLKDSDKQQTPWESSSLTDNVYLLK